MAKKKEGLPKLKLTITEDPEGVSYLHLNAEDFMQQLTVRELTVVDLRRPRTGGAQVVAVRKPGEAAEQ